MTINILMATYNGEAFLAEQIKSIQAQTVEDWQLLIRDDGSSDKTREIISDFVQQDKRIQFINAHETTNYGVIKSFYTLLKYETADYYCFSDQDDVWLPNKLEIVLTEATQHNRDIPLLVYTDLKVVDRNLDIISDSMIRSQSHHANTSLRQELTENTVTGGTMLINHALAESWNQTEGILMHDWYLALLAAALGKLIYIDVPTELYRQHDSNVLGARTWSKRFKNWFRPHLLFKKYWWLIKGSQDQAKHLLSMDLEPADREMVADFVQLMTYPLRRRWAVLEKYRFAKNRAFHTLVFRTLLLTKLAYRRD